MVIESSVDYILSRTKLAPRVAVVLGSGLGAFADELTDSTDVHYSDIPGWPPCTCIGHAGKLVFGKLQDLDVVVMAGRSHLYEGYTPAQVTMGVRVLHQLGVQSIVITNAAGGINLAYSQGALVLISDHINLQGSNPLIGPNDDSAGPRFPDMTEAYSLDYRKKAQQVAQQLNIQLDEGVYAALTGPNYETPAEIHYLRTIGADLVGMSTVPEVIIANYLGMRVLAISCVTNMAAGILPQKLDHKEVMETGHRVRDTLIRFLKALLPKL